MSSSSETTAVYVENQHSMIKLSYAKNGVKKTSDNVDSPKTRSSNALSKSILEITKQKGERYDSDDGKDGE